MICERGLLGYERSLCSPNEILFNGNFGSLCLLVGCCILEICSLIWSSFLLLLWKWAELDPSQPPCTLLNVLNLSWVLSLFLTTETLTKYKGKFVQHPNMRRINMRYEDKYEEYILGANFPAISVKDLHIFRTSIPRNITLYIYYI